MKALDFVYENEEPISVQTFLMKHHGVSRRLLKSLKRRENGITLNGSHVRSIDMVHKGDTVSIQLEDTVRLDANPELYAEVAFENDSLVIYNKPAGMPVHPSILHRNDTLGNCFSAMYPGLTFRPVHRLDMYTSGLCMVAKDAHAASCLQGSFRKLYYAAVQGMIPESGEINAPIARMQDSIITRCVREDGKAALTKFRRIASNDKYSLAEVIPVTGRTHQIRVHFAYKGHPLAGDDFYGGDLSDISRPALHCGEMTFTDPVSGQDITVRSALPEDMAALFKEEL